MVWGLKDVRYISAIVLCYANAIIEDDRRRSGLPIAPLDIKYGNNIKIKELQFPFAPSYVNIQISKYINITPARIATYSRTVWVHRFLACFRMATFGQKSPA